MNPRNSAGHEIPSAEWAAAVVGLTIVLIALAALTYKAVWVVESAPKITVTVLAVEPQEAGYLVRTRVANSGTTTAAQVVIEGALNEERSQVTLDYVPASSERTGALMFSTDPRRGELKIRALGYQDP